MSFSGIPLRINGTKIDNSWFDGLRAAGVQVENFLGAGFIQETKVAIANGQAVAANITGLVFDHTAYTSARILAEVNRFASGGEAVANGVITVIYRSTGWDVIAGWVGDDPGLTLTITAGGQVQYTSTTLSGTGYVGNIKFKAITFGV